MQALPVDGNLECKTVWLSDVHLGSVHCKAETLLAFLDRLRCERLYLVGDIIDLWAMQRRVHWPESHNRVVRKLLKLSRQGVRITYIPGNHDQTLRDFCGSRFGNIRVRRQAIHTTSAGIRLLVIHGDELDYAVRYSRLNRIVGDAGYDLLMWVNRHINEVRERAGKPYWSLAKWIKVNLSQADRAIQSYQLAAVNLARSSGVDGIVCGHLHHPVVQDYDGTLYCNDGDWVESCSALIEDATGELCLVRALAPAGNTEELLIARGPTETRPACSKDGTETALPVATG